MSWRNKFSKNLTWFALAWLLITLSLVTWWWIHGMTHPGVEAKVQHMLYWEGIFLLPIVFFGGSVLVYLTYHHQRRSDRLQDFFSIFAHDLKTSMSRMRLQGELLEESGGASDPKVTSILKDIQRLDLQLENSLWMAQIESGPLLIQKTRIREIMEHLRNEFSEARFEVSRDAELFVDRRAFVVILRNLFRNSVLHGKAEKIDLSITSNSAGLVTIEIGDNGGVLPSLPENLGRNILSSTGKNSNGLGLFLSRRLMERMGGELRFSREGRFLNILTMKGNLI